LNWGAEYWAEFSSAMRLDPGDAELLWSVSRDELASEAKNQSQMLQLGGWNPVRSSGPAPRSLRGVPADDDPEPAGDVLGDEDGGERAGQARADIVRAERAR
jgi:hypothetical protein